MLRMGFPAKTELTSLLGLNLVGGRDIAVLQLHYNLLSISGARTEACVLGSDIQGTRERQLQHELSNLHMMRMEQTSSNKCVACLQSWHPLVNSLQQALLRCQPVQHWHIHTKGQRWRINLNQLKQADSPRLWSNIIEAMTDLLLWGELVVAAAVCLKQGTGEPLQKLL